MWTRCCARSSPRPPRTRVRTMGPDDLDGLVVPDLVGEVVGWRAWRVIGTRKLPILSSVVRRNMVWHPDRWTHALCGTDRVCRKGGPVPGERCTCGMYAAATRRQLVELGYNE